MGAGQRGCGPTPIERIVASARSHVTTEADRQAWRDVVHALAARRRALGLTQSQVDTLLGVTDHQVAKWECMARLPGAFMMACWAGVLGVKLQVVKGE